MLSEEMVGFILKDCKFDSTDGRKGISYYENDEIDNYDEYDDYDEYEHYYDTKYYPNGEIKEGEGKKYSYDSW